jgi:hypothetical protein
MNIPVKRGGPFHGPWPVLIFVGQALLCTGMLLAWFLTAVAYGMTEPRPANGAQVVSLLFLIMVVIAVAGAAALGIASAFARNYVFSLVEAGAIMLIIYWVSAVGVPHG